MGEALIDWVHELLYLCGQPPGIIEPFFALRNGGAHLPAAGCLLQFSVIISTV
jgi:hypothetical protein